MGSGELRVSPSGGLHCHFCALGSAPIPELALSGSLCTQKPAKDQQPLVSSPSKLPQWSPCVSTSSTPQNKALWDQDSRNMRGSTGQNPVWEQEAAMIVGVWGDHRRKAMIAKVLKI